MGESACLMQPFSYAAPQGDSVSALGQSISFGRFMSEKLDWEKWSAFSSQNPYVAEAEKYSRPGSVAEKKAFFEAHYKKLAAARKAAAEEALLLEQQSKSEPENLPEQEDINGGGNKDGITSKSGLEITKGVKLLAEKVTRFDEKENCEKINGLDSIGEEQVEKNKDDKPLLKKQSKAHEEQEEEGKLKKSSMKPRISKVNSCEKTKSTPKSKANNNKNSSYTFTPAKEFNRLVSIIRKIDGSRTSKPLSKDCKTPLRTPSNKVSGKGINKDSLSTPLTSKCRDKTAPDSSVKTSRGKWNFLPSEKSRSKLLYSPSCFTPFGLRTEERAERRKKKLEEKFKAMESLNQKLEATVEKEESKLQQRLCFKAKPLPNFYKQRPKSTDQTKKALLQ